MPLTRDRPAAAPPRRERGFVVLWLAITLVVLLGVAAFAVDFGHAYLVAARAQSAAALAALGGTVFLPGEPDRARATALDLAADNGFAGGVTPQTYQEDDALAPTQLRVTIHEDVDTFFASVLGFDTLPVTRTAVADYDQPVAMGSPANTFGNAPDGGPTPAFWVNVAGPRSVKHNGDAHQAALCTADWAGRVPDGCAAGNIDYLDEGYYYTVRVRSGGTLRLEAFDPGFVHVGDNCPDTDTGSDLAGLYAGTGNPRYQPGSAVPYCTGDQYFTTGDEGGTKVPPWTSYQVFLPDETAWDPTDNPPAPCAPRDFEGYIGSLPGRALQEVASGGTLPPLVTRYFRNWETLCEISAGPGDYLVRIRTNAKADGTPVARGGGHNRFALRATVGGSAGAASIFGSGRMAIYANAPSANTTFSLARVLPGAAGRRLVLQFFDTGDADGPGALTVLPPDEATVDGADLDRFGHLPGSSDDCTYSKPPDGPETVAAMCSAGGVSKNSGWNGQWVTWTVPIPAGYSCDFESTAGCWLKINFDFPSVGRVNDTTTWTAALEGNPVRIIE